MEPRARHASRAQLTRLQVVLAGLEKRHYRIRQAPGWRSDKLRAILNGAAGSVSAHAHARAAGIQYPSRGAAVFAAAVCGRGALQQRGVLGPCAPGVVVRMRLRRDCDAARLLGTGVVAAARRGARADTAAAACRRPLDQAHATRARSPICVTTKPGATASGVAGHAGNADLALLGAMARSQVNIGVGAATLPIRTVCGREAFDAYSILRVGTVAAVPIVAGREGLAHTASHPISHSCRLAASLGPVVARRGVTAHRLGLERGVRRGTGRGGLQTRALFAVAGRCSPCPYGWRASGGRHGAADTQPSLQKASVSVPGAIDWLGSGGNAGLRPARERDSLAARRPRRG